MKHTVVGVFEDSKLAGQAVSELKEMGYTKEISVAAQDVNKEGLETTDVKRDLGKEASKGAGTGAVIGGTLGAIAGVLTGAAAFTVPGVGIAILGPLATALAGAGVGGAAGTVVGALVDMGIPEHTAKEYEQYVQAGQVLITATVKPEDLEKVEEVITRYQHMQQSNQHMEDICGISSWNVT